MLVNPSIERNIALCYVRQSYTRDESDITSPERQRDNIAQVCQRNGWIPEWYEDVGGHRSGTSEDNRPEWLALKKRLVDSDVVAIVANDLSRLHRNLARLSQLIETLEKHQISLVLASSNSDIDVTTLTGQLFAQMRGLLDAFYAKDISAKTKDSVSYRKRRGVTVGIPPFGTVRNQQGYLEPTPDGAWLLPNGQFVAGTADKCPEEGAIWRGYYDCAHQILKRYVDKKVGLVRLSYEMNEEGWAFRNRDHTPRPITSDDIRRVVANWAEYGGIVWDEPTKKRPAYESDIENIPFVEERAVFPIKLLRSVAQTRYQRTTRPVNQGVIRESHYYPLAGITFCSHCEHLATFHNDPNLRSRLGGTDTYGKRRYRHKGGVKCGCHNRSVPAGEMDAEFGELIKHLNIRPEALDLMTELAIQSDRNFQSKEVDFEKEKQEAIALGRRRIEAAINLYRDGRISREEYLQDVERNEREIAHWQSRTSDTEKLALELALCMEAVNNVQRMWDISDDEERQALARNLFTELVYDLDARQIVGFKLKPWADRFLILEGTLYNMEDDMDKPDGSASIDEVRQHMMSSPIRSISLYSLKHATQVILRLLYFEEPHLFYPGPTKHHIS